MKSKERVLRALEFRSPDRIPIGTLHLPTRKFSDYLVNSMKYRNDIMMTSYIYKRKKIDKETSVDAWGAVWKSLGNKGEVIDSPLKDWSGLDGLKLPNYKTNNSIFFIKLSRAIFRKKFLIGNMPDMIFSLCHYLRGYVEFMQDLYDYRENIEKLVSIIVKLNIELIDKYADLHIDCIMGCDDLGLQNSLMINPVMWREIFKPGYKAMIDRAHERGMKFFLHSCGYIIDIIGDFIEIGLDALQCDQQDNMGVDRLNERYGGKITFFSPVDIQTTLSTNDEEKIRLKSKHLVETLGSHNGGFIGKVYPSPKDIGVTEKSIGFMLQSFLSKD